VVSEANKKKMFSDPSCVCRSDKLLNNQLFFFCAFLSAIYLRDHHVGRAGGRCQMCEPRGVSNKLHPYRDKPLLVFAEVFHVDPRSQAQVSNHRELPRANLEHEKGINPLLSV
jgi:hypothetical protein